MTSDIFNNFVPLNFTTSFKAEILASEIPKDAMHLFTKAAQLEAFRVITAQKSLSEAIDNIDQLLNFDSYTQVRALKAGASLKQALLFLDPLKTRALEAGATVNKALKVKALSYVQHLEGKNNIHKASISVEQSPSAENPDFMEAIQQNLAQTTKYNLVLDIDDVLCREISDDHSDFNLDYQWTQQTYPQAEIITWTNSDHNQKNYFCYPGFDKLILAVSSWSGWSVNFFSAEIAARNEHVIPSYFTKTLGNELYSSLSNAAKLNIFSKASLTPEESSVPGSYAMVKNLNIISDDIDNIVLADDNCSNAAKSQEQVIGLSIEASKEIISMIKDMDDRTNEMPYNPLNNAFYIMGILLSAKTLIQQQEAYCLREAIDLTLRYEGSDATKCNSLWYNNPSCASKHDAEYSSKMQEWVMTGQEYLEHFTQ